MPCAGPVPTGNLRTGTKDLDLKTLCTHQEIIARTALRDMGSPHIGSSVLLEYCSTGTGSTARCLRRRRSIEAVRCCPPSGTPGRVRDGIHFRRARLGNLPVDVFAPIATAHSRAQYERFDYRVHAMIFQAQDQRSSRCRRL